MSTARVSITAIVESPTGIKEAKKVSFVNSGCTYFFNAQHLFIQLSAIQRSFFDYLCEQMRATDNDITINDQLKASFISHLMRFTAGKKNVTINQQVKWVQKFCEIGLLLKTQNKGRYIVNPKYVYKNSKTARLKYLQKLIASRSALKLPLNHLLNLHQASE